MFNFRKKVNLKKEMESATSNYVQSLYETGIIDYDCDNALHSLYRISVDIAFDEFGYEECHQEYQKTLYLVTTLSCGQLLRSSNDICYEQGQLNDLGNALVKILSNTIWNYETEYGTLPHYAEELKREYLSTTNEPDYVFAKAMALYKCWYTNRDEQARAEFEKLRYTDELQKGYEMECEKNKQFRESGGHISHKEYYIEMMGILNDDFLTENEKKNICLADTINNIVKKYSDFIMKPLARIQMEVPLWKANFDIQDEIAALLFAYIQHYFFHGKINDPTFKMVNHIANNGDLDKRTFQYRLWFEMVDQGRTGLKKTIREKCIDVFTYRIIGYLREGNIPSFELILLNQQISWKVTEDKKLAKRLYDQMFLLFDEAETVMQKL